MKFRAELLASGKTTTGFEVPDHLVDELGGGSRPKVTVTVNGFAFRTSIARMGGRYLLGVSAERRVAAGIEAGDVLDVAVVLDTAPRVVAVPGDLAAALAQHPTAKACWESLSYSKQLWHALQVENAKADDTRAKRVAKSIELLSTPTRPGR
jgi:hypothetical protein